MTNPQSPAMTASTDPESVRLFEQICREVVAGEHEQKGIGTLGERTLHVVLKNFYETDPNFREIKVGRFVADIKRGDSIVEIQTRAFRNLREKIPVFIAENSVKVVFPVAAKKFISWVDPETGEISERRRSPKSGNIWDFLAELWELRPILPLEGLSFDVAYLELEEFRLLTGRSKDRKRYGAKRAERIPTSLVRIETFESPEDFAAILPELPDEFTVSDLSKAAKLRTGFVGKLAATLVTLGVIEKCGNRGRAYLYRKLYS